MMMVSSKEPKAVKNLLLNSIPECVIDDMSENYGGDMLWPSPFGWGLCQRKQFPEDFLASLRDGRLAKEILQMEDITWKLLIIEGKPQWSPTNGNLLNSYGEGIHKSHFESIILSIDFFRSCRVRFTNSVIETCDLVKSFYEWTTKETHTGFCAQIESNRERINDNGIKSKTDWRKWILMHMPDLGPVGADRILEHEPEPLRFWNDGKDLEKIKGIGRLSADKLRKALKPK